MDICINRREATKDFYEYFDLFDMDSKNEQPNGNEAKKSDKNYQEIWRLQTKMTSPNDFKSSFILRDV